MHTDHAALVAAIRRVEPDLHPQHIAEALPSLLTVLRCVCVSKSTPPLPEPETKPPIAHPFGGGGE